MKNFILITSALLSFLIYGPLKAGDTHEPTVNLSEIYSSLPDVNNCTPGVLSQSEREAVLELVNEIRALHDLPSLTWANEADAMSMQTNLNIVASGVTGHGDAPGTKCYSPEVKDGRAQSNLHYWASGAANYEHSIQSIIGWLIDSYSGNPDKVGHRRALMNPFLKSFSFGRCDGQYGGAYVTSANFLYQPYVTGSMPQDMDFVAYPYEYYPPELVDKSFYLSFNCFYNKNQWFDNGNVDYGQVQVEVREEGGGNLNVHSVSWDLEGWGSIPNGLVWKVDGLKNETRYNVSISNVKVNGETKNYSYWFTLTNTNQAEKPAIPALQNPQNGAEGVSTFNSFSWNTSKNANYYHLQVATDDLFENTIIDEDKVMSDNYSMQDLAGDTEYFWRVKATNDAGSSEWSDTWSFTTKGEAPGITTLLGPADGSSGVSVWPEFSWNAAENAANYYLQVSEDDTFKGFSVIVTKSDIEGTSFKLEEDKLEPEMEYFWRVQAVNGSGHGDWSEVRSFTTADKLASPASQNPADQTQDVKLNAGLSWGEVAGATKYRIQVSPFEAWNSSDLVADEMVEGNSFALPENEMEPFSTYYWRIMALSGLSRSDWTNPISFVTEQDNSIAINPGTGSYMVISPNPATNSFTLQFNLTDAADTKVRLYSADGYLIANLFSGYLLPGEKQIQCNLSPVPSGNYIIELSDGESVFTGKISIVK